MLRGARKPNPYTFEGISRGKKVLTNTVSARMEEKTEWMVREGGHKRYEIIATTAANAESAEQGVGKFMCSYNMRLMVDAAQPARTQYTTFPFTFQPSLDPARHPMYTFSHK